MASVLALLFVAALAPAPAAQARPAFSLEAVDAAPGQSYFVYDGKGGSKLSGRFRVVNTGNSTGPVELYGVDGTTGETSGAVYENRRESRRGVGRWMRISERRLSLAPRKSKVVGFTLAVPTGAKPGEHLGGIVAENATLQKGKNVKKGRGRFAVNVRNLTVLAVQVNIPGPRAHEMQIGDAKAGGSQGGHQAVLLGLANKSNVMLKPALAVRIEKDGKPVQRFRQKLDTFTRDSEINYPMPVRGKALPAGKYRAYITLRYAGKTIRAVRDFTISKDELKQVFGEKSPIAKDDGSLMKYLPWLLLALAALAAGIRYLRNKRRRPDDGAAPAPAAVPAPVAPTGTNGSGMKGNGRNRATRADVERLLAEIDQLSPVWFLRQIADGVLSGGEASAEGIRGQEGLSQDALDVWSSRVNAAAERAGVARPFSELRVGSMGVVYHMDLEVAGALQQLVDDDGHTGS